MIKVILLSSLIAYKPAYNLICDNPYSQFDFHTRKTTEVLLDTKYQDGRKVKLYIKDIFKPNKEIDFLEIIDNNKTSRFKISCKIKP